MTRKLLSHRRFLSFRNDVAKLTEMVKNKTWNARMWNCACEAFVWKFWPLCKNVLKKAIYYTTNHKMVIIWWYKHNKTILRIHDKRTLGNTFHGFTLFEKHELEDWSILANFFLTTWCKDHNQNMLSKIHLIRSQTQFKWEFYQILARVNLFQFLNL